MNKHIQIVTLPNEKFLPHYLISHLAELWREQGYRVTVGPISRLDADIGILHVDRTLVPAQCVPGNHQGRPLLNASILDISKRRISSNILESDSGYTGPVIIKTNANYFGWPEHAEHVATYSWIMRRVYQFWGSSFPWWLTRQLLYGDYPILNSLAAVPGWVWHKNDLVVEKFMPEVEGNEFVLRIWIFFGDQEYGVRLFSRNSVVKVQWMTRYEYIDSVPETIREVRRKLGMDFGKFDYVMVNGEAVLLDVNKTPTVSAARSPSANLQRLASGLTSYLE